MEWSGYHDSIPTYVSETCQRIRSFQEMDCEKIFDQEKEKYLKQCKNHYLQQAFRLCWAETSTIL